MINCPLCNKIIYLRFQHGIWIKFDDRCHMDLHECIGVNN